MGGEKDAPAVMPGVEEIARLLCKLDGLNPDLPRSHSDEQPIWTEWVAPAATVIALFEERFAPILTEKERGLRKLAEDWDAYGVEQEMRMLDWRDRALAAEAALAAERERLAVVAEDVCATPPTDFAGMELEAFHRGADAMNEAIAAAIRAQGE